MHIRASYDANSAEMVRGDGIRDDGNSGCDPQEPLPLNEDTVVEISFYYYEGRMEVSYNGELKCEGNAQLTRNSNARVFASNPWHEAAQGTIDDFYLLPIV